MSSPVGHILGATIAYTASSKPLGLPTFTWRHYVGLAVLAWIPDIDTALLSQINHRGLTHGIIGTLVVSGGFYLLLWLGARGAVRRSRLAAAAVLCALVHPVIDALACPACPVEWLSPLSHISWGIDPFWTMLPQPYFYIVGGSTFYLPVSAILEGLPQVASEIVIFSGILDSLVRTPVSERRRARLAGAVTRRRFGRNTGLRARPGGREWPAPPEPARVAGEDAV